MFRLCPVSEHSRSCNGHFFLRLRMTELSLHSGEGPRSECHLPRGLQIEECCHYKPYQTLRETVRSVKTCCCTDHSDCCFRLLQLKRNKILPRLFPVKGYTNQFAIFELRFTSQLGLLSSTLKRDTHEVIILIHFVVLFLSWCPFFSIATAATTCAGGSADAMRLPGTLRCWQM